MEVSHELAQINNKKPIWLQKPEGFTKQEYISFYKSLTNGWKDHVAFKHFSNITLANIQRDFI